MVLPVVEQYVGLLREFIKPLVGRAEEKRSDVAYLVETTVQSSPCQGSINPVEHLRKPRITDSCKTRYCAHAYGTVVYDPVSLREH